ncbi:MAG: hypothetical protein ACR2NP_00625, partial [Pirellulaceae bacterium]
GDIVGTLRYMAPERFAGQSDRRSDMYSLALTLYELCTLQPAYTHTDRAQLIQQVMDSSPAAPRKIRPEIPRDLETVIIKAMAREPGSRYETAGQMAADLRRFVANRPVLARRVSLTERIWRWSRRHPSRAALAVSMMLLAAIVTAGSVYFGYQERQHAIELKAENARVRKAEQATSQALKEKETALAEREAALREKERKELGLQAHIFWSHYRNAEALHGSGVPGQNFKTVSECVEAYQRLPELGLGEHALKRRQLAVRAYAIAGMGSWDVNTPRKYHRDIPEGFTNVFGIDFANSRYAHSDEQGNIAICDLETGETISTLPGPGDQAWVIRFTPDGRYMGTRHHHAMRNRSPLITIWNLETGEPVAEFLENDSFGDFVFASDGEHFALSHGSGEIGIYATADGQPIQSLKFETQARFFHFADQDRELIVATRAEEPMIQFWSWQEDEPQLTRELYAPAAVDRLDWNERMEQLAVACDTELHVWPPGNLDAEPTIFSGHGSKVVRLQLQPQGDLAMTYSWDRKTRMFDLVAGQEVLEIAGARMTFTGFSPDGRRIGFNNENDKIGIWEIPTQRPFRMIRQSLTQGARRVAFHPQFSRLIAMPSPEGVQFIDHLHNEPVILVPSGDTSGVQFSSDGQFVFSGGERGVVKWPLAVHIDQHDRFQVDAGEPETIDGEPVSRFAFHDEQQMLLTMSGNKQARLIRLQEQAEVAIGPHERMSKFGMDPAGKFVVTTTWQGQGVKIWDALTGDLVTTLLPDCSSATPDFSPDGDTLVISTSDGQTFWSTDSWEQVREIPRDVNDGWHGGLDYSPDGQLVAATYTINRPQLIRAETGETVAVMDASPTIVVGSMKFSHDNRYLAILDDGLIHVWDLEAVYSGLAENGMHW